MFVVNVLSSPCILLVLTKDIVGRDLLPVEQRQEVLRLCRCGCGDYTGEAGKKTDDFIGIFMLFAKDGQVERLVSLAEALAVFVYEKRMMIIKR